MATRRPEDVPLLKIRAMMTGMNPAEEKLARYILEHPKDTINSTIESLAGQCGTSYATVSRFCRKMGYTGFKDFKNQLIDDVVRQQSASSHSGSPAGSGNSDTDEIMKKVFRFSRTCLDETESIIDPKQIDDAARAILSGGRILFIGAGTSGLSARYAFTRFFRLGITCMAETDPVLSSMQASILGDGDVLFAVSSSGRTTVVNDAARIAQQQGARVISLSDYAVSPLNSMADINLYTTPRSVDFFLDLEMPLLIGQITLIDILFSAASTQSRPEAMELYSATKKSADRLKD